MAEPARLKLHEDVALFREAVNFTAAETGFAPRLIEKDYFCTVVLEHLMTSGAGLVFRGGTCLAKVHAGFYRLSADLDFLIPTPVGATRADRRDRVARSKAAVSGIAGEQPALRRINGLTGANQSMQYVGSVSYSSLLGAQEESIKIEVGLREPLERPAIEGEAKTLLLDPVSAEPAAPPLALTCLSWDEAMAEKLRAALSRREVAIRDFFDVDHAVRRQGLRVRNAALVELTRRKLAVPGNEPVDVSPGRLAALIPQLATQLKPVLRDRDFADFDLDRAFKTVAEVAIDLT